MPNIVVFCLDTVRKDFFDKYASELQQMADVSLSQCRSVSSWTVPSHASIFTGQLPSDHGIHTGNINFGELPSNDTIMGDLTAYETRLVSANPFLHSNFHIDILFDEIHEMYPGTIFADGINLRHEFETDNQGVMKVYDFVKSSLSHRYPMKSLANGIGMKIDQIVRGTQIPNPLDKGGKAVSKKSIDVMSEAKEPCFLFVNYMDAHGGFWPHLHLDSSDHSVPRNWSSDRMSIWDINTSNDLSSYQQDIEYYRDLYGAAISYVDRLVAATIKRIQTVTDSETVFIVTSDHGENLAFPSDDGLFEHKSSLSEGVLHVPCCLIGEEIFDQGQYFSQLELRSLIGDLAEDTTDDYFKNTISAELIGTGKSDPDVEEQEYWKRMLRCGYRNDEKIVWDSLGRVESYRIDPEKPCWQEHEKEIEAVPEWAQEFFDPDISKYKDSVKEEEAITIDEETHKQLDELGYF